jgi:hypothetical protein
MLKNAGLITRYRPISVAAALPPCRLKWPSSYPETSSSVVLSVARRASGVVLEQVYREVWYGGIPQGNDASGRAI